MQKTNRNSLAGIFLFAGIALLIMASCTSSFQKGRFMNSFRKFMEKTEKYASEYTYDDWEKSDSIYTKYVDIDYPKYRDLLTDEERSEVHELMGTYTGLSLKYRSDMLKETIIEGIKDTRDIVKGIKDVFLEDTLEYSEDEF